MSKDNHCFFFWHQDKEEDLHCRNPGWKQKGTPKAAANETANVVANQQESATRKRGMAALEGVPEPSPRKEKRKRRKQPTPKKRDDTHYYTSSEDSGNECQVANRKINAALAAQGADNNVVQEEEMVLTSLVELPNADYMAAGSYQLLPDGNYDFFPANDGTNYLTDTPPVPEPVPEPVFSVPQLPVAVLPVPNTNDFPDSEPVPSTSTGITHSTSTGITHW